MLATAFQKQVRASLKEQRKRSREWEDWLASATRDEKIDALCDNIETMFGGGGDVVVYAKGNKRERVRDLLHHLLRSA